MSSRDGLSWTHGNTALAALLRQCVCGDEITAGDSQQFTSIQSCTEEAAPRWYHLERGARRLCFLDMHHKIGRMNHDVVQFWDESLSAKNLLRLVGIGPRHRSNSGWQLVGSTDSAPSESVGNRMTDKYRRCVPDEEACRSLCTAKALNAVGLPCHRS